MNLEAFRDKIDCIDNDLLRLFEERMKVVAEVAEYKKSNNIPVLDNKREEDKLQAVAGKVGEDMQQYARVLCETLFEISRSHQHGTTHETSPLCNEIKAAIARGTNKPFPQTATVACQGVEGAFSQEACKKLFKHPSIQYFKTFDSVFSAIENGFCEYGVLPLENSTAGSVTKIYNLMQSRNFKIVSSIRMKIDHVLAAPKGVAKEDIREVLSHEQAISQCAGYLEKLGANVKVVPCENTALAAKDVSASGRTDAAAICSAACAKLYGLNCVEKDIQDRVNNYTRFICISKNLEIYPGSNKTSIMLALPHVPGALYKVLAKFYTLGISLNKLESRPQPHREFEFMFYLDLETSVYTDEFFKILDSLQEFCEEFKYLGSYIEVV